MQPLLVLQNLFCRHRRARRQQVPVCPQVCRSQARRVYPLLPVPLLRLGHRYSALPVSVSSSVLALLLERPSSLFSTFNGLS